MRTFTFAKRCALEILRDPLSLGFGLGFPIVLLLLLSAIQSRIPVQLFEISALAPGISVFGLSFMTLFSATLISRDREDAFLQRLYTTPLSGLDFILGYTLPLLPMSMLQTLFCYLVSIFLGLKPSFNILYAALGIIPLAVFNISLGLLFGSILGVKQAGGICGALFTNLSAWLSGVWFDLELVGGTFKAFAEALPFFHAVEVGRALLNGNPREAPEHIIIVSVYAILATTAAVVFFIRQTKKQ